MKHFHIQKLLWLICCLFMGTLSSMADKNDTPTAGNVYRIWNTRYTDHFMYEDVATHQLKTKSASDNNDYSQLFLLVENGSGFMLRNVKSGGYVGSVTQNEEMYKTGASPYVFNIQKNTWRTDKVCYNLFHTTDNFCMHEAQGQRVVRWHPTGSNVENHPSEWLFEEVDFTDEMHKSLEENQQLIPGAYYLINDRRIEGTNLYMFENNDHSIGIRRTAPQESDLSDVWVVQIANGQSALQNLGTGRYIQLQAATYQKYFTAGGPYKFWIVKHGIQNGTTYWNIANKQENKWGMHGDSYMHVVPWGPAPAGSVGPSEWIFKETGISNDKVKQRLSELSGISSPKAGKYYRIISYDYGRPLRVDYATGTVTTEAGTIENDFSQLWKLVANGDRFDLVNAYTGKYILKQNGSCSVPYKTDIAGNGGFLFTEVPDPFTLMFAMVDQGNVGIHCAQTQGYQAVGWYVSSSANRWVLKEVTVDEEKLKQAQAEYQSYNSLTNNADVYWQKMSKYFADNAATQIAPVYAGTGTDELKAQMQSDGLPDVLQNIVLKIKNQVWASYKSKNNWEKKFRIANYKAYSDNFHWAWKVGMSYQFGNLTNPTGITAYPKNTLLVFVDSDIPADATLEAETVQLCNATGTRSLLKKGLNIIAVDKESNLFIRYIANTHNTQKKLADFPEMKIHVEGGSVNGYFDLTKGDDNQVWKDLCDDGLLTAQALNLKTKNIVFHMNASKVKQACPEKMSELLDIWNDIVQMEIDLKGLQAKVADRCNNVLNATSVKSSYMYATNYGSYYEESTLASIMNYENMRMGGSIWGPAHEFGHNHQNLFNPHGCTEVSNNLFSNVAVFNQGVRTSRGNGSSQNIAGQYAAGKHFADFDIWCKTQMYYKLWLYFHAAGNNPKFYQTLFSLLNEDPMKKPHHIQGPDEWLKMALKCCEAAEADLSEFFQMYGFFVPVNQKEVDDYGKHTLTATQEQIDEVLAKMHAYPKKLGNIIFIDDHIRQSPATYAGAPEGTMRQDYEAGVAIGKMGDHGQWEDFKPGAVKPAGARLKESLVRADGTMSLSFDKVLPGTMGYKIYNKSGKLLFIANTDQIVLPVSVVNQLQGEQPVIKAAKADGTDTQVTSEELGILDAIALQPDDVADVYTVSGTVAARHITVGEANGRLPLGVYIVRYGKGNKTCAVRLGK